MALLTNDDNDSVIGEINVTPLVDVMLVLLTVFIVTAPLLMNAVQVRLPKASASVAITQPKTAHISVTEQGDIFLDETRLTQAELETQLKQAGAVPDYAVEIHADEKAEYGIVAKVMAAIQRAGIARFSFVMMPEAVAATDNDPA